MPVALEAPSSVKLTAYERPADAQWILHLVNVQSVPADSYNETKADRRSIPLTEDVLPVHDLTLTLRPEGRAVKRAWLPLSGTDLETQAGDGAVLVRIPRVHVHEIAVIEFDAAWEEASQEEPFEFTPMIKCPEAGAPAPAGEATDSAVPLSAGEEPEERDDLGSGQE